MTRRLFPWRREPEEAVTPDLLARWIDALAARSRPVLLPALLDVDPAQPAPDVLASANRQPTANGYRLHKACDAVAPGWRGEPRTPVDTIAELREPVGA